MKKFFFVLLVLFVADKVRAAGIVNGNFQAGTPPWRAIPGFNNPNNNPPGSTRPAVGQIPAPLGAPGNRGGFVGSTMRGVPGVEGAGIGQAFGCGNDPDKWCTITFDAIFQSRAGIAENAYAIAGNGSGAAGAVRAVPIGQSIGGVPTFTTYTLSVKGCLNPTIIAFFAVSGGGDPPGIMSRLTIDNVTCVCTADDQSNNLRFDTTFAISRVDDSLTLSPLQPNYIAAYEQLIPSISTWGLIILALLLAGTTLWLMWKKRAMAKGGLA